MYINCILIDLLDKMQFILYMYYIHVHGMMFNAIATMTVVASTLHIIINLHSYHVGMLYIYYYYLYRSLYIFKYIILCE